jgi:hypothetical protein
VQKGIEPLKGNVTKSEWRSFHGVELGCLVLVSALIMARQFTDPHFVSCVTDDSILQMGWVRQFAESLGQGNWLPRWLPDSNGGYGSPVFVFYSPLVYYVTAFMYWLTGSVILSMKLARGMGLFLSGLSMFLYAKSMAGRRIGVVAALIYLALPFHVLDVTYWTLYAEPWAWIWFPLVLFFERKILKESQARFVNILGFLLSYATLILTHLISAYIFSFVVGGYVLACSDRGRLLTNLKRILIGTFIGLALVAFFLLPAFYEQRFVHLEYSTLLPEFDFHNTFLFFPNPKLTADNPFEAKTVAILQVITLLQGAWVFFSVGLLIRNKPLSLLLRRELSYSIGVILVCLFLMSRPSVWIWQLIPGLPQIQFSTRWLSIYSLIASIIIAISLENYRMERVGIGKWLRLSHFTMAFMAGVGSMLIIFGGCFLSEEHTKLARKNVYNAPEYNPKAMRNWKQRIIHPVDPLYTIAAGKAQVRVDHWGAESRQLSLEADTPLQLRFRLYDYPGWQVTVDGDEIATSVDEASGALVAEVPSGKHTLQIIFQNTWWRKVAMGLSATTALAIIALLVWNMTRAARRKAKPSRRVQIKAISSGL